MQLNESHSILGHFELKGICQVDPVLLLMTNWLLCWIQQNQSFIEEIGLDNLISEGISEENYI